MREYAEKKKTFAFPETKVWLEATRIKKLFWLHHSKVYLNNDLKVTQIYQVIENQLETCFKKFGDTVSEVRREGDRDDNCTVKIETIKLLGNAACGKTLTNKANHINVAYARRDPTPKLMKNLV